MAKTWIEDDDYDEYIDNQFSHGDIEDGQLIEIDNYE